MPLHERHSPSSSHPLDTPFWKSIWNAPVPSKIKICIWRACLDILFTRSNLGKKGVAVDNHGILCNSSPESVLHGLCECPFVKPVFFFLSISQVSFVATYSTVRDWISTLEAALSSNQFALFLMLIHPIWRARNAILLEGKVEHPTCASHLAGLHFFDFSNAQLPCQLKSI